jgi:hypothetical protein
LKVFKLAERATAEPISAIDRLTRVACWIPSHPPPHAGCPRGDPGPLGVLYRYRPLRGLNYLIGLILGWSGTRSIDPKHPGRVPESSRWSQTTGSRGHIVRTPEGCQKSCTPAGCAKLTQRLPVVCASLRPPATIFAALRAASSVIGWIPPTATRRDAQQQHEAKNLHEVNSPQGCERVAGGRSEAKTSGKRW